MHLIFSEIPAKFFRILMLLVGIISSGGAMGAGVVGRFVESTDKAYVMDLTTGLIWTRCYIGSKFQNGACQGFAKRFNRADAVSHLAQNLPGWRIPSTKEAASLIECEDKEDRLLVKDPREGHVVYTFDEDFGFFRRGSDKRTFPFVCSGVSAGGGKIDGLAFPKPNIPDGWANTTTYSGIWTSNVFGDNKYPKYYSFEIFSRAPYFRDMFVNCGPGGCFGPNDQMLLAVIHETELKRPIGFDFLNPQIMQELAKKIPPTVLTWKSTTGLNRQWVSIALDQPMPPITRSLLAAVHTLVTADFAGIPVEPSMPARASFLPQTVYIYKGEFETTRAFEERQKQEIIQAERDAERKYQDSMSEYSAAVKRREELIKQMRESQANPEYYRKNLLLAWDILSPKIMGNPMLVKIQYDADQQRFSANLRSTISNFDQEVLAPFPIDSAEKYKWDLTSGKIAPKVDFDYPAMTASWALVENSALRAKKFSEASTISRLEELIHEYPDSTDARSARARVLKMAGNSKELFETIERNKSWPEATTALKALSSMQQSEFRAARASDTSAAYDNFLREFGGPDPQKLQEQAQRHRKDAKLHEEQILREELAQWERDRPHREAVQLCMAQKATCIASCPRDRVLTSRPDSNCEDRCNLVRCD